MNSIRQPYKTESTSLLSEKRHTEAPRHHKSVPKSQKVLFGLTSQQPSYFISTFTVIILVSAWFLVTHYGFISRLYLPPPQAVFNRFTEALFHGLSGSTLAQHTGWSMARVFGAFAIALVTAIPLGLFMGVNRVCRGIADPIVELYRPLPPLAYLPLIIIWLGIDETSKLVLIFLAMFAPLTLSARAGVRSVALEQLHAAHSLGASNWQILRHVIFPAALPDILTGMRIAIGFGWTTLVAAEMVAARSGLGFMVLNASEFLNTDIVVMGIFVIGIIALTFDLLMRYLEKRLVPWKGKE